MGPIHPAELADVIDCITLDDERLFRCRQAFVAKAGLDESTIEAVAGFLAVVPVVFMGSRFDIDVQGAEPEPAFIAGALDRYENIIDLIAWPVQQPDVIASYAGHADLIGRPYLRAYRPPSDPIPVYRNVARWLRAGGMGIVPIGPRAGLALLIDIDAPLLAEDDRHGADLSRMREVVLRRAPPILVTETTKRAA